LAPFKNAINAAPNRGTIAITVRLQKPSSTQKPAVK
jgi:hypothetical protein